MRRCAHCRKLFAPKRAHARYCSDACRAAEWKANHQEGRETRVERVPRHSGRQVSYRKAVEILAERLIALGVPLSDDPEGQQRVARAIAEDTLARALPVKQRVYPTPRVPVPD